jgi:hypothetical protein
MIEKKPINTSPLFLFTNPQALKRENKLTLQKFDTVLVLSGAADYRALVLLLQHCEGTPQKHRVHPEEAWWICNVLNKSMECSIV